jgi:hypothetical protein
MGGFVWRENRASLPVMIHPKGITSYTPPGSWFRYRLIVSMGNLIRESLLFAAEEPSVRWTREQSFSWRFWTRPPGAIVYPPYSPRTSKSTEKQLWNSTFSERRTSGFSRTIGSGLSAVLSVYCWIDHRKKAPVPVWRCRFPWKNSET